MDGLVDRLGAVRVRHRPGAVPVLAVVAVAGEPAADPADRVAERQRGRSEVKERRAEEAPVPGPEEDADRAPDQALNQTRPAPEKIFPNRSSLTSS